jgi:hypothetical protein
MKDMYQVIMCLLAANSSIICDSIDNSSMQSQMVLMLDPRLQ